MRVTFITPPSEFLLDERVFVSLGILKVAAVVQAAGYVVEHLDLTGRADYEAVISQHYDPSTTYCLTATTPQLPAAVRIARLLRSCRTVLGGPHATMVGAAARAGSERAKKAMLQLLGIFGSVVIGDGEHAIWKALAGSRLVDADPKTTMWQTSKDYSNSPWPARELVDMETYHYEVDKQRALSLITQLGCPFECGFCGGRNTPMLRRIRTRPAGNVIAEMMHLHNTYGVTGLMFYDDELNVNPGMIDLMSRIKDTGIPWRLRGFVKAELFTSGQAGAMYEAGFRHLLCGFESGDPRILSNINKKATLDDNTRMLRTAHAAGLKVKALMSFGHPGESLETITATRDWLLQERPDDFDCTVITVYPGTPYYDKAVSIGDGIYCYSYNGDLLYSEDVDFTERVAYYKGVAGHYNAYVWTDYLSRQDLVTLRDQTESAVREKLNIPYPRARAPYDHSMGQGA